MSENDSDKLKYRKSMLKGSVDAESARRRREENNIKIRKSKKEERLQKRRMRNAVRLFYFVFSHTFYQIFKINCTTLTEIQCHGIFGRQVSDVQYDDDEYAEYDRRDDGATIETASDFVSSDSVPRFGEEIGSNPTIQKTSLHREKSSHF